MTSRPEPERTEQQVLQELSEVERALLKRVLEIELGRAHSRDADTTEEILNAVRGLIP